MKKINVIGAGFAGLTVSLRLAQKGFSVELFESSSRVGGLLGTDQTEFGIAERAANALINTQKSHDLFMELGLTPSTPLKTSKKRFLFRKTPRQWPLTFIETFQFFIQVFSKLLRGKKSLHPHPRETLQNWGYRNVGKSVTKYILEPAMQGIYANEISGLSASLILGPLFQKKTKKGPYKGLLTGPGGMQDLVNKIENRCRELGVKIHLNSPVEISKLDNPVIIATSASAAAQLLHQKAPEQAAILSSLTMTSLLSVTIFFEKAQNNYQGFGCLIPRGQGLKALGVLMNSYIFKDRDKTYNETWMLGGLNEESLLDYSDVELMALIQQERMKILNRNDKILSYRINRWQKALPYYNLELENSLEKLSQTPLPPGMYLHGNYLVGIGLSKILERSDLLAEKIASDYV